jgi:hypothetical protein
MGASTDPHDDSKPWLSSAAEQVQDTARATTDGIKDRARHIAEQQKAAGADQLEGVAHAVDAAADQLKGQMPRAAEYIDDVAGKLGAMASALRERSVDDMVGNVAEFARRQPALFFAGALAVGFALSRFAKSSADRGS